VTNSKARATQKPVARNSAKMKHPTTTKGTRAEDAAKARAERKHPLTMKQKNDSKPARTPHDSKQSHSEGIVPVDRRRQTDRRTGEDRRKRQEPVAVERRKLERRAKVSRRRQIDPTTCERDYTTDELEFMGALDEYKRTSGRMFPTCSEILEVIRNLGYAKTASANADASSPTSA
jgi:hypothetical protein